MLLTLLSVSGQARTRRPDQPKTLGRTVVHIVHETKRHTKFRVAKFRDHPRCRVGGVLVPYVPYERKKERKKERKNVCLSSSHLKQHCFYSKHIGFIAQERLVFGIT